MQRTGKLQLLQVWHTGRANAAPPSYGKGNEENHTSQMAMDDDGDATVRKWDLGTR